MEMKSVISQNIISKIYGSVVTLLLLSLTSCASPVKVLDESEMNEVIALNFPSSRVFQYKRSEMDHKLLSVLKREAQKLHDETLRDKLIQDQMRMMKSLIETTEIKVEFRNDRLNLDALKNSLKKVVEKSSGYVFSSENLWTHRDAKYTTAIRTDIKEMSKSQYQASIIYGRKWRWSGDQLSATGGCFNYIRYSV